MQTLLLTFVVFLLSIGALSIGVLFGREPIKGSCGGLSCGKSFECAACPHNPERSP
jgi:hypothetical protein